MNLLDLDLSAAAAAIASGRLDPVELTEAYLHRIEETETGPDSLAAWYAVDAVGARASAERAALEIGSGRIRGPLHGIPVGVKDLFDTAGLRTTYGSIRFRDHVPTEDAEAVSRLREAGAVILGKQATHEFAWGGRTDNPHFGPTHNPHEHGRIPGGSTGGGGASVAARSSLLALGSDTAGSVRIPAALCGCVGFKPTRGWMPLTGAFPLSPSYDHVGLMARTCADAALAMEALTGQPVPVRDLRSLRVGLVGGASAELLDEQVAAGVAEATEVLRAAGAEIVDVPLTAVSERVVAFLTVVTSEAEPIHREAYLADPASYGPDLARRMARGAVDAVALAAARRVVADAVAELTAVLGEVDVVMSASVPMVAPPIGELSTSLCGDRYPVELVLTRLTSIANAAGLPAVSVPAPGEHPLPVGVQLLGRAGDEATVLSAAALLG